LPFRLLPVQLGALRISSCRPGFSLPEFDVAAVCQQVSRFVEALWRTVCCLEVLDGSTGIVLSKCFAPQQKVRADIFPQNKTFAALPGLEAS
jgi:hypothetical protein